MVNYNGVERKRKKPGGLKSKAEEEKKGLFCTTTEGRGKVSTIRLLHN